MARRIKNEIDMPERTAMTPEGRDQQMIALATALAEKQMREGTASSQVIVHYLKLGTEKARMENEKLREEVENLRAKTAALESEIQIGQMLEDAINSMKLYQGQ